MLLAGASPLKAPKDRLKSAPTRTRSSSSSSTRPPSTTGRPLRPLGWHWRRIGARASCTGGRVGRQIDNYTICAGTPESACTRQCDYRHRHTSRVLSTHTHLCVTMRSRTRTHAHAALTCIHTQTCTQRRDTQLDTYAPITTHSCTATSEHTHTQHNTVIIVWCRLETACAGWYRVLDPVHLLRDLYEGPRRARVCLIRKVRI